jgi:hypothetical protein
MDVKEHCIFYQDMSHIGLCLREITYQTMVIGMLLLYPKVRKDNVLGIYCLLNAKHALKVAEQLGDIWLAYGTFRMHDPIGLVKKHCNMVRNVKAYVHEDSPLMLFSKELKTIKR